MHLITTVKELLNKHVSTNNILSPKAYTVHMTVIILTRHNLLQVL